MVSSPDYTSCNYDDVKSDKPIETVGAFLLSRSDIDNFIKRRFSDKAVVHVKEYVENGALLCYIVQFDDGWVVICSDKRLSPIIARSEKGVFLIDEQSPEFCYWSNTFEIIKHVRTKSEVLDSTIVRYWEKILNPNQQFYEYKDSKFDEVETKSYQNTFWVLQYVDALPSLRFLRYNVEHLMNTRWGQRAPWDVYAPYALDISNLFSGYNRCPTGCTPVAMSQVLYYWNRKTGVPSEYVARHHTGYVDLLGHLDVTSSEPIPQYYWDHMAIDSTATSFSCSAVSRLMIDVGYRVEATYSPNGTGAWVSPEVFNDYGLNCDVLPSYLFSYTLIKLNVLDGLPVVMTGWNNDSGHTWVVDGYQEHLISERNLYRWRKTSTPDWSNNDIVYTEAQVSNLGFGDDYPEEGKEIVKGITSVEYTAFMINWCWDGDNINTEYQLDYFENSWETYNQSPSIYYDIYAMQ